ncbi:MAG: hypothetical protein KF729_26100 [Sandaracinaceae bacterium]|nr:hypothetical protein [Sandaracinaceae bacterium]
MTSPVPAPAAAPAPRGGLAIGVECFGYVALLLGIVAGLNWGFDLDLRIKGWGVPAHAGVACLGVASGALFAALGRWLSSASYARAVSTRRWIPWLLWPSVVALGLVAIAASVGLF